MRFLIVGALVVALAPVARAQTLEGPLLGAPDSSGPLLGAGLEVGSPSGSYVRVRENQLHGTKLPTDDLGIVFGAELGLRAGWRIDGDDAIALDASHLFLWGEDRLKNDASFNGSVLQGGSRISTVGSLTWWVFELDYQRALFRFLEADRGFLALDAGVRVDWLNWSFGKFRLAPASIGREGAEHFYSQVTPIPVLGLTARFPIAPSADLWVFGRGFRWNHLSSGRKEGGIVYYSQSVVEAGIGVAFSLTPSAQLTVGYRMLYDEIDETSHEDDNKVLLIMNGAMVGFTYVF